MPPRRLPSKECEWMNHKEDITVMGYERAVKEKPTTAHIQSEVHCLEG